MDLPAETLVHVHPLSLTQDDEHAIRRDAYHIPTPVLQDAFIQSFSLQSHQNLR